MMNQANTMMLAIFTALSVMLVVGTMIGMPQMIGLANAQSSQGSGNACPQGFTLSQGQCTAPQPTTLQCIPDNVAGFQAILQGNTCTASTIIPTSTALFASRCMTIPGHVLTLNPPGWICTFPATQVPGQCPSGTTLSNGQCVTRPGSVNRP